jgi:hypothetical protein
VADVTLILSKALICFAQMCHPAVIGTDTLEGTYPLIQRHMVSGEDVLKYRQIGKDVYSIHRTLPGRDRLLTSSPASRRHVSKGCINVSNEVYSLLLDEVDSDPDITLTIKQ